jgi:hypothetical protein
LRRPQLARWLLTLALVTGLEPTPAKLAALLADLDPVLHEVLFLNWAIRNGRFRPDRLESLAGSVTYEFGRPSWWDPVSRRLDRAERELGGPGAAAAWTTLCEELGLAEGPALPDRVQDRKVLLEALRRRFLPRGK